MTTLFVAGNKEKQHSCTAFTSKGQAIILGRAAQAELHGNDGRPIGVEGAEEVYAACRLVARPRWEKHIRVVATVQRLRGWACPT